ncbi:hypothetical protein ACFOYX_24340 [Micromonospora sp. GCM10011541]
MNWRQFVVAMVQALVWPAVVVVVLVMYRRRVAELLGDNLRRLRAGPLEVEWEKAAEEVRATIEAVEAVSDASDDDQPSKVEELLTIARSLVNERPPLAIAFAWEAARYAFESHLPGEGFEDLRGLRKMLARAKARGLVNPGAALVFERLFPLGMLSYEAKGTEEQAREFVDLVEDFRTLLDKPTLLT